MNGNLPAVAKAMILASLPLCALMAACDGGGSGGSDYKEPTEVDADTVLRGIYPQLNEAYVTIVDTAPDEEPALSLQEISRLLDEEGARVERGALIRMIPAATGVTYAFVPPAQWPQVLAWALEVDLSSFGGNDLFDEHATTSIVFLNADDGTFISAYQS